MQPFGSNGPKTVSSNTVAWRDKHPNSCPEEVFKVFATFSHPVGKIFCSDKLEKTIFLIMVVPVKHSLIATCRNASAKILD
jgi:hypothetical protein